MLSQHYKTYKILDIKCVIRKNNEISHIVKQNEIKGHIITIP